MACTSCAAASIFRLRSNCSVTFVLPSELVALIEVGRHDHREPFFKRQRHRRHRSDSRPRACADPDGVDTAGR
jgi:hypothetical protein